jgi:hypothetical protein
MVGFRNDSKLRTSVKQAHIIKVIQVGTYPYAERLFSCGYLRYDTYLLTYISLFLEPKPLSYKFLYSALQTKIDNCKGKIWCGTSGFMLCMFLLITFEAKFYYIFQR